MNRSLLWVLGLGITLVLAPGAGADSQRIGDDSFETLDRLTPQRERDFLTIINEARSRLKFAHTQAARADVRLSMQVRIGNFVAQGIETEKWVGIVKLNGHTRDGDVWLNIEIAPDVTLMTAQNPVSDPNKLTLIGPGSPIFKDAESLKVGEKIVFSGMLVRYLLADDDAMVLRPQLFAHFSEIKPIAE